MEIAFSPCLTPAISCKVRLNMTLKLLSGIELCVSFFFNNKQSIIFSGSKMSHGLGITRGNTQLSCRCIMHQLDGKIY